jgi:hypothetical protein
MTFAMRCLLFQELLLTIRREQPKELPINRIHTDMLTRAGDARRCVNKQWSTLIA